MISYKKGVVILACGDPALNLSLLRAGSPLREDDDSLFVRNQRKLVLTSASQVGRDLKINSLPRLPAANDAIQQSPA